jgi:uncharacterized protein DUF1153
MGNLRALPASLPVRAHPMDYSVGCRCVERHAASFGAVHAVRWQGRDDPDPRVGRTADAGAGVADGLAHGHHESQRTPELAAAATVSPIEQQSEQALSDHVQRVRVPYFLGPYGAHITLAHLPPRSLKRWLPHHKTIVVAAVRYGLLTFSEACERYGLSPEEYLSWQRAFDAAQPLAATVHKDHRD